MEVNSTPKNYIPGSNHKFLVTDENNNIRLDLFISKQFADYSRSFFQKLIYDNLVTINGQSILKPGLNVKTNDEISVQFPTISEIQVKNLPSDMGIELIHQHPDFLIVYKPAGIIIHAANTKDQSPTLVDWLLMKFKEISEVGSPERPGIVHRLDMLTSGILVIPRNNSSHMAFGNLFKNRMIQKKYLAVVEGSPDKEGTIEFPITRHSSGHKMVHVEAKNLYCCNARNAREAKTDYKVVQYFDNAALIEAHPITGRTHQIRVHCAAIGHPIIGDIIYGKKSSLIDRQALHSYSLEFDYEGKHYTFQKDIPEDFNQLLKKLKKSE